MVSLGEGVLITPARLLLGVWPRIALAGARFFGSRCFVCGESDASKPIVTGGAIARNDDVCGHGGFHGYKTVYLQSSIESVFTPCCIVMTTVKQWPRLEHM